MDGKGARFDQLVSRLVVSIGQPNEPVGVGEDTTRFSVATVDPVGYVIRTRRGRPGLTENELVDLVEAAATRAGVDLAVLTSKRRMIAIKDPIYEVTLVQNLVQYLLMYPALDLFDIGWEVAFGQKHVDIVLESSNKIVLVECKDFAAGQVNADARKLREIAVGQQFLNAACYVLAFWRSDVPDDVGERTERHFRNKRGLDSSVLELVAHKRFQVFAPDSDHAPFGVGLFKVRL
jgi:hypothetical protein